VREAIERTGAAVVVHAAGPYLVIGDGPLRAALALRRPYVDMCPRSDLYAALRARYDAEARASGVPLLLGASTAGGLTGLLTRFAAARLRRVERVRASLCVHNFAWGGAVVADYLLRAGQRLPNGRAGAVRDLVRFPGVGRRRVFLADTLDYAGDAPVRVDDVEYHVALPGLLPQMGMLATTAAARAGLPVWRLAPAFGRLAGVLGGTYSEGGLLHQAWGESEEGRGVFEMHVYRPYGNVRNPSLLCALAAARLAGGELPGAGVLHPAAWLGPAELIREMRARAVLVRSRFRPEGAGEDVAQWTEEDGGDPPVA
jgi:hypothetical protein